MDKLIPTCTKVTAVIQQETAQILKFIKLMIQVNKLIKT